ncbi:unnamed protein product, partial [marine sediment metagenome]
IGAVDPNRPNDRANQSVYIMDDRTDTGSDMIKDSVVAGGILDDGNRDLTWKLSPNTTTMQLLAGEEIHFAVHSTDMFAEIVADQEFYWDPTNVAFDITLIPEPATMCLLALGGLALLNRRRK